MSRGKFRIGCYGDNRRFRVDLEDDAGTVLLMSQYREQKPMCLNEITWIRAVGAKRANYLLGESQRGKLMSSTRLPSRRTGSTTIGFFTSMHLRSRGGKKLPSLQVAGRASAAAWPGARLWTAKGTCGVRNGHLPLVFVSVVE